jgi:hypothetical protein
MDVNWIAVVLAAVSAFMVGGLWYSPLLFGKAWQRLNGLSDEQLAGRPMGVVFGLAFIASLVAAAFFAMFLGRNPGLQFATAVGFGSGLCWIASSYAITYLFEGRPLKLWLVNSGYHTVQFTLYGLVLGAMG